MGTLEVGEQVYDHLTTHGLYADGGMLHAVGFGINGEDEALRFVTL
jgi:hypothetical protein